jgi:hypothetical protein
MLRGPPEHITLEMHLAALPEDPLKVTLGSLDETGVIVRD